MRERRTRINHHIHLAYEHLGSSLKKEGSPPPLINSENRHCGGQHIDDAGDHRRHESRIGLKADGVEEHRRVEHDDVDARDLLEEGDEHGHHQVGSVLSPQQVAPGVLHSLRRLTRRHKVVELLVHVSHAADFLELASGPSVVAAFDHGVGSVREEHASHGDDKSRNHSPAQAQTPTPPALDLREPVVQQIRNQNADCDRHLEPYVQSSSVLIGSHLGEVKRDRL